MCGLSGCFNATQTSIIAFDWIDTAEMIGPQTHSHQIWFFAVHDDLLFVHNRWIDGRILYQELMIVRYGYVLVAAKKSIKVSGHEFAPVPHP